MDLLTTIQTAFATAQSRVGVGKPWLLSGEFDPACWAYGLTDDHFNSRAVTGPLQTRDGPTAIREAGRTGTAWVVSANHYKPGGMLGPVSFRGIDRSVITRTIVASQRVGNYDIRLSMLDAEIPYTAVAAALILPADAYRYLPLNGMLLPSVSILADETNTVQRAIRKDTYNLAVHTQPPSDLTFWEPTIAGASGSPLFTAIDRQPVLLTTWFGADSGPSIADWRSVMEGTATGMSGRAVTFSTVNLSAYAIAPAVAPSVVFWSLQGSNVLQWLTQRATTVTISGIGTVPASGSWNISPATTTTYTLTATGDGGTATQSWTAIVGTVPPPQPAPFPIITFSSNLSTVSVGSVVTLTWSVSNSTGVIISGIGSVTASGSAVVAVAQAITYRLTATGPGGTNTSDVSIGVALPMEGQMIMTTFYYIGGSSGVAGPWLVLENYLVSPGMTPATVLPTSGDTIILDGSTAGSITLPDSNGFPNPPFADPNPYVIFRNYTGSLGGRIVIIPKGALIENVTLDQMGYEGQLNIGWYSIVNQCSFSSRDFSPYVNITGSSVTNTALWGQAVQINASKVDLTTLLSLTNNQLAADTSIVIPVGAVNYTINLTSPAVASPANVKAGVSNLGVVGTFIDTPGSRPITLSYTARNLETGLRQPADAAHHTLTLWPSGLPATNRPTAIGDAYSVTLTEGEVAANTAITGASSTANVVLDMPGIEAAADSVAVAAIKAKTDNLPADPASNAMLPIIDGQRRVTTANPAVVQQVEIKVTNVSAG